MLSKDELANLLTTDIDAFNQEINGKAIDLAILLVLAFNLILSYKIYYILNRY